MLDDREWVIELVQEIFPFCIAFGSAKSYGVVFERLPLHEEQVAVRSFETPAQLMRDVTHRRGNQRTRNSKCFFECVPHRRNDVENCDFENHGMLRLFWVAVSCWDGCSAACHFSRQTCDC